MAEYMTATSQTELSVAGRKVSYNAVFTGVITALALVLLLSMLGSAIGLAAMGPIAEGIKPLGAGPVLWSLGIPLACFIVGGFAAAAVSRSESSGHGVLLGFLVWGLGVLFMSGLLALSAVAPARGAAATTEMSWLMFFSACLALIGGLFGGYLGSKPLHRSLAKEREHYIERRVTT